MANAQTSLRVEVHLDRASIVGLVPDMRESMRLVDVLGDRETVFKLQEAEASLTGGSQVYRFKSIIVKKADLLYAIPRETSDQIRARALFRTGISSQTTAALPVGVLLATCFVSGTMLIATAGGRPQLEVASLPAFFALTGAVITRPDGSTAEEQIVVVKRDGILALGRLDES